MASPELKLCNQRKFVNLPYLAPILRSPHPPRQRRLDETKSCRDVSVRLSSFSTQLRAAHYPGPKVWWTSPLLAPPTYHLLTDLLRQLPAPLSKLVVFHPISLTSLLLSHKTG